MIGSGIIASAYGEMTRRAMGVDMGAALDSTMNCKMAGPLSEGIALALATPGHTQNQGVRDLPIVQVEEVRRCVVGFEHRKIFGVCGQRQ